MYFRMILFSYACIVSILEFVVDVQADTKPALNNNELSLSLSNEQVTEYNYERTIQSGATENNQDHSITTNINTEFVQEINSSNELDLNIADSSNFNSALNMDIMSDMNKLNNNEASITKDDGTQMSTLEISNTEVKIEGQNIKINGGTTSTTTSTSNSNGSTSSSSPKSPTGDSTGKTNGQEYDSNGNKIVDTDVKSSYQSSSYYGYNLQNIADINGKIPTTATSSPGSNGSPSSVTPTSPNGNSNSGPNSKINGGTPSTTTSTSNSNGSPSSSSPKSPTGDSTGKPNGQEYDSNGNKIVDTDVKSSYQSSSYYGYNLQNIADINGKIPTTATSSPGSNGSPSSVTPTSPNGNSNSSPNSKINGGTPSTTTSTSNSNGSPSSSSPKSPTGDSTGKPNGQEYDSNGNKIVDIDVTSSYQSSSYYGYNLQNIADINGKIPTTATSSPGSNGSPSSVTPTSPNGNSNSGPNSKINGGTPSTTTSTSNSNGSPSSSSPKSPTGDSTGKPNGQEYDSNGNKIVDIDVTSSYQSSSYYGYNLQNIADINGKIPTTATSSPGSNGSPSSVTPTSPNGNSNSGPNSKINGGTPSTTTSTSNSNGSPSSSSPKSPTGDSTGKPNGQEYDSNGNKIVDTDVKSSYQSSSYYGYNLQNIADINGKIPTTATSSPGSNGSPSSVTPTSPNGNSNSGPNSKINGGTPSTTTSTSNSNGSPSSSSPKSPTGDSTGKPNGQEYDSNGNKIVDTDVKSSYQSSSYYGYNLQNIADINGKTPTTATSSPGSNGSPSSVTPTSPNGNSNSGPNSKINGGTPSTTTSTSNSNGSPSSSSPKSPTGDSTGKPNGQEYDSNGNKIVDTDVKSSYQSSSYYGYNLQNIADINGKIPTTATSSPGSNGSPSSVTPTSPNGNSNSGPNSKINGGTPSTTTSTSNSNGSPSSSSPKSPTGDSTGKPNGQEYDSNGNKIVDTDVKSSYQSSSYYGYNLQNIADINGKIPTTATSSPGSNGSPSSVTPTSPNGNSNSGPNSKINGGTPSTTTSTSNSNGSPSSSSPKSPTGDSTGKPNGQEYDSNGNKIVDIDVTSSYQSSSYYGYNLQNIADINGKIPTTATSSPGSNGSPSSVTPTSPNGNSNSGPNSKINGGTPSTTTSTSNSNGSPSSSSPKSPTGDSTGKPNGQEYDSNGNKIVDTDVKSSYQSSSYYGYNLQNIADINGKIPTTATSSSGSNGSPSSVTPTSPNGNSNSGPKSKINGGTPSSSTSNSNGSPSSSSPKSPTWDSTGKPNRQEYDSNGNKIVDIDVTSSYQSSSYYGYNLQNIADINGKIPTTATSSPGSNGSPSSVTPTSPNGNSNSGPNSKINGGTPSTTTSTSNSNGSPSSSSPKSPTGDSTGKPNGQEYDSNGNKIVDTDVKSSYQSSSYYGYNLQNIADINGKIPTTATSSPGSNGSPSSVTPTSPNGNSNSGPNSKINGGTPSTTTSTSNSNGSPSSSSPKSPTGDSTGKPNGQEYDSNGNKIVDTDVKSSYQSSSYYGYNLQNIADINGKIPTTATSSPGSNGSPSSVTPTSPNGNSNSGPNSKINGGTPSTTTSTSNSNGSPSSSSPKSPTGDSTGKPNGQEYDSNGNKIVDTDVKSSYQSSSYYGYNLQNIADINGKIPTTATSSPGSNGSPSSVIPTSPNGNSNSGPKSNINGGTPSTSTSNSNGSPSSSSPKSPTGDSTGKPNGQEYDSNGNKIVDTDVKSSYQSSSYYGYNLQNIADINGKIPTTATSSPGSNGSPSSVIPTSPNGNSNSGPKSNINGGTPSTSTSNSNGSPSSSSPKSPTGDSTGKPNGQEYDSNGNKIVDTDVKSSYQSSSYYGYNLQNIADINGKIPTTATSSPGSNGSPSSVTPTSPNGNSNSGPNSKINGGTPSTSTSNSNGSPSSSSPKSPTGDSTDKPNGQEYDSNGNKIVDTDVTSSYQSSNYYGYIQNTADQDTSYKYPPKMSEYLNNQLLQNSVSNLNLQNTATPNQFGIAPSSSLTMQNGNSKDSPSVLNTPTDMNGPPHTVDQTLTGTEYSSFGSEKYGSSNYDIDYELRNMDVVEVLNDGQLNMDDRYISDNYDDVNNDGVNIPLLNENGDVYNNYFYADNSIKTERSLNGNFDTQNDGNYVDGHFGNVPFDDGNMQEPSYEPYAPNLNARYENSQLQYALNQNPPPFRGYPYMGNDITPFETNIYPDISPQMSVVNADLYNYNNIDGIEYDQTKIGIEETSPENIQLSNSDLNTFSSNQNAQTTDSFIDADLTSDHLLYDFVDADNRDLETIDSNYIVQVNENNVYNGQGFNGYNNMQSIGVPEYNQFNGDTTTYLSNLGTFETSSLNTGTDDAVDVPEGPYLTPQLLNSKYDLPTSSDLNKQSSDSNSFLVDNVQLNGYLYRKTDTSNDNTQVEGSAAVNSNGSPMNVVDNRFKSIQNTILSKNNVLDVGQNVYGANGQVIGIIYKPSGIVKTKNRHKYSGSSSYSSINDSEFSDDMHAIGHATKRAARDAIGNIHDNIKDAYDTTKAVGKAVGNIAGNAASKAADGVGKAADNVEKSAKTAYQGSKDAVKGIENAVSDAADDVEGTA